MSDMLTPEEFLTLASLIERLMDSPSKEDTLVITHGWRWGVGLGMGLDVTSNAPNYQGFGDTLLAALMRAFWPDL